MDELMARNINRCGLGPGCAHQLTWYSDMAHRPNGLTVDQQQKNADNLCRNLSAMGKCKSKLKSELQTKIPARVKELAQKLASRISAWIIDCGTSEIFSQQLKPGCPNGSQLSRYSNRYYRNVNDGSSGVSPDMLARELIFEQKFRYFKSLSLTKGFLSESEWELAIGFVDQLSDKSLSKTYAEKERVKSALREKRLRLMNESFGKVDMSSCVDCLNL